MELNESLFDTTNLYGVYNKKNNSLISLFIRSDDEIASLRLNEEWNKDFEVYKLNNSDIYRLVNEGFDVTFMTELSESLLESPVDDAYQLLGVSKYADNNAIKKAYYKLAKKVQPDLHPEDPDANNKLAQVNNAYDLINKTRSVNDSKPNEFNKNTYSKETAKAGLKDLGKEFVKQAGFKTPKQVVKQGKNILKGKLDGVKEFGANVKNMVANDDPEKRKIAAQTVTDKINNWTAKQAEKQNKHVNKQLKRAYDNPEQRYFSKAAGIRNTGKGLRSARDVESSKKLDDIMNKYGASTDKSVNLTAKEYNDLINAATKYK